MAQVINTNSLSLMTQNNLNTSQSALNTAIQRLSSGLRINSAKDDAAGQAIANRFTANIRGLTQAQRNANDGISLAQTTEGALTEVNNNLQRVRELAVQAATGSNSASDLQSIQDEIKQRLDEIDRVSAQTQFNGVKVLAADSTLKVQVGANDTETIDISLKEITAQTLGLEGFTVKKTALNVGAAIDLTTQLPTSLGDAGIDMSGALQQLKDAGVSVDINSVTLHQVQDKTGAAVADAYVLKVGDEYYAATTALGAGAGDADEITLATVSGTYTDNTVTAKAFTEFVKVSYGAAGNAPATYATVNGSNYAVTSTVGAGTSYGNGAAATIDISDAAATPTAQFTGVATASPLAKLDAALSKVDTLRSSLGAVQNRFDSVISNLGTTVTNLSASRSRIQDADYATEVSNMTRAQILQQAGTSVLAQANQTTQNVLSLLR
ncbi:FliC/FljB family flagellin [Cupriavidus sp. DB3]|uniref:FliC/FljB family flagellin n=1 Tax=Cupriavidus sp. DB3 TaxID=2873259 RepID=UPI001CF4B321|nr:FliC/FljB family flagellin [Cupriavidus sp. DB3]MCA7086448.1 FliC/FljB family flagellin [Cupriavidus sp. DB3]